MFMYIYSSIKVFGLYGIGFTRRKHIYCIIFYHNTTYENGYEVKKFNQQVKRTLKDFQMILCLN